MPLPDDDDFDYSRSVDLYLVGNSPEGDLVSSAQALMTIREWIRNSHLDGEDLSNPYIQSLAKEFKALQHMLIETLEPHCAPAADNTVRQPITHETASAQARPPVFTPPAPPVPAAPKVLQAGPAPMDAESTSAQLPLKRSTKPKPRSYAQVTLSAPHPRAPAPANTLFALAQALPGLPAERIVQLQQQAQGREPERKQKGPTFTSQGPLRKQVLMSFRTAQHRVNWDVSIVYRTVNTALMAATAATRVLSVGPAYDGYAFETTTVATTKEIDVIRGVMHTLLTPDSHVWVGLPQSTLYLKVLDVPFFHQGSEIRITTEQVMTALTQSPIWGDTCPTGPPRIIHNSKHMYFNIWDSQQGSTAKSLINKTLLFGKKACFIRAAAANPGTLLKVASAGMCETAVARVSRPQCIRQSGNKGLKSKCFGQNIRHLLSSWNEGRADDLVIYSIT
ncbi:hypothetical protein BDN70DRAFT_902051 [Pholiota conissans]|uniref:Uncharacterized protein n=1 Tax=Pholiota conissans TaxID=109636 RepID=A0A9P5YKW4_9AGAR|nr:hypothetical protein BDN70DRAFT_902051 [Pholiota conissans]